MRRIEQWLRKAWSDMVTLFLCGDVMTGRGIDQVLPHPSNPTLHESYMESAREYVALAEAATGPIPMPVDFSYVWGDALAELERVVPDMRIINLETAITRSDDFFSNGINYRMNPENVRCLTAAGIDCCSLANNHVLDWGYAGLLETLETLKEAGLKSVGAGRDQAEAESPVLLPAAKGAKVAVFGLGSVTSGIPRSWAARPTTPGVNLLKDYSLDTVKDVASKVQQVKGRGVIAVVSIHWGPNWGYAIGREEREFAHGLIDRAGIDVIHGHSSHHIKGIEVYKGKPIIYGCGDFLNDYEGIRGYESFRGDLGLMYFITVNSPTGELVSLRMTPTRVRHFRVNRASGSDARWLTDTLNREGSKLGTRAKLNEDGTLTLSWS
ncbi:MAG: CapA family protein [Chloroflexi bacterium]|nr:CapA family protein [Chloroflexota bacterium]